MPKVNKIVNQDTWEEITGIDTELEADELFIDDRTGTDVWLKVRVIVDGTAFCTVEAE